MKKKDLSEARAKDTKEIAKLIEDKKLKLDKVRVEISAGEEKNVKAVANLKREIAQLMTVLKEKEIMEKETIKETK